MRDGFLFQLMSYEELNIANRSAEFYKIHMTKLITRKCIIMRSLIYGISNEKNNE